MRDILQGFLDVKFNEDDGWREGGVWEIWVGRGQDWSYSYDVLGVYMVRYDALINKFMVFSSHPFVLVDAHVDFGWSAIDDFPLLKV